LKCFVPYIYKDEYTMRIPINSAG